MSALGHVEGLQHQREDQPDGDTGLAAHASLLEGERRDCKTWEDVLGDYPEQLSVCINVLQTRDVRADQG